MASGVRVTGLRQTIRQLEKFGVSTEDLKRAMSNISTKVVNDAKTLTPFLTGALEGSIRASKAKNKAVIRAGTARVDYASYVEYGTGKMSAREFLNPAVQENEGYAVNQLEHELSSLIRRYNLN